MARYQAGSFKSGMERAAVRIRSKAEIVHEANSAKTFTSIVFGSNLTGAPGQPIGPDTDTREGGALRESWKNAPVGPLQNRITTDSPYAKSNEDGIARPGGGPYVLRSKVGGRHSVALTIAGFPHIVASSLAEVRDA